MPPFRPIIDTTGTPHYNVGKFLSKLLNPVAQNEYTLRDLFQAVSEIRSIPKELFLEGYRLVSFDVVSLSTNVSLTKTIKIILDRVFEEKLVATTLSKRTLKKLILDSCTKTAFSFNNKLFEQTDGVSMGSALGPVLANIILSEFEKLIVSDLIKSGVIKFYRRYVDDTLVLIKLSDIPEVSNIYPIKISNLQLIPFRCRAKFMTCEIHDYDRSAHAHTMRMIDIGSEISQVDNNSTCVACFGGNLCSFLKSCGFNFELSIN